MLGQYIDSQQQNPKTKDRVKEPAGIEPMLALDKSKQVSMLTIKKSLSHLKLSLHVIPFYSWGFVSEIERLNMSFGLFLNKLKQFYCLVHVYATITSVILMKANNHNK